MASRPALCCLLALVLACSSPEERAEQARQAAGEALKKGDRVAALAALHDLRESSPDTPEALLEHSTLLIAAGEAPQVVWLLEAGIARFPERDDLRLALGQVALLVGDASTARRALAAISPDSEQHLAALVMRARAELMLGDLERALEILGDAERRYPDRPEARLARIGTLLAERRSDEARAALEEAKASLGSEDESTEDARRRLRSLEVTAYALAAKQGETESAIEGLRSLVDADPDELQAWQALVQTLATAGRLALARDLLDEALQADPERMALYPLAASLHAASGEREEAARLLRAFGDRAESPSAVLALAQFHLRGGEQERVLELLDEAFERFPDEPMLRLFHAETLVTFGRLEEARSELARYRRAQPDDPRVEYLDARLDLATGDAEKAAARLEKLAPRLDDALTHYWLGQALEASGDPVGAERRYRLAVARDPQEPVFYVALIRLAERRGDWRTTAFVARRLVQRAPGLIDGWIALSTALVNLAEGAAAEEVARPAVERFPDRPEPGLLLAAALRTQGRNDDALAELVALSERFGSTPQIAAERALTLGFAGRLQEGMRVAQEALASDPDSAELHVVAARLAFQAGDAEKGAASVDRALELDLADPTPLRVRAEFRTATGRLEGAREDCERYLALRPDDPNVHFILGVVHAKAGRSEAATASYRRAAELDPQAFAPRNNLAELLAAEGDLEGALAAAQEAYALADDNPYVMDTLGWLYLRRGLVTRSISVLEDAHRAAPELPDAQLHLALAYRDAGRTDDARQLLSDLQQSRRGSDELRVRTDEALRSLP
jgi:tetratricopeptide (TPR) repeat protein